MKCTFTEDLQSELTESEAIRRAQQGDAAAFELLYKAHSRRVYSICLRMLKNTSDAEDMTQQVFLRVFRKIGTFRGDAAFSTWLHRVTVNGVLMHLRRNEATETSPGNPHYAGQGDEDPREVGPSDTSMLEVVDRQNLVRAIHDLPCGHKRAFLLHDVMGYKHSEISELVGCSIACSKSRVQRARKRMQHLLQPSARLSVNERRLPA